MASDIKRKRLSIRPWRIGLGVIATLLALLIASSAWFLGSQSGAQFALSYLIKMSAGTAHADGVHGSLAGPLAIDRIVFENEQQKITLQDVKLDWLPLALLHTQLHVTSLHAARIIYSHKIQQQPPPSHLPDNIALPLALQVDHVQVDASEIAWGPATIVQLGKVAFQLDFDRVRYRLQLAQLAAGSVIEPGNTIAGDIRGQATLAVAKPYALQGEFVSGAKAVLQQQTVGLNGRVRLDGSLQELTTSVDLTANNAALQGQAMLRPFAEDMLGKVNLTAHDFDIADFSAGLPHTGLEANFVMQDGKGKLSAINHDAGLVNDGKVPVAELQGAFAQTAGQLRIEKLTAKLGTSKEQAGIISGNGQYANGALNLALELKAVDLRRLDRRMKTTQLDGQVGIKRVADKQELTAQLSEPFGKKTIALSAHASMADDRVTVERADLTLGKGSVHASGYIDLAGQNKFSAEGSLNHFQAQELGQFNSLPGMDLNGKFSLHGARQPKLVADLAFNIFDSQLAGHALQGEGQLQLRTDRLQVPRLLLAMGNNRLEAHGELSAGDAQLVFTLDAPNLDQLGEGYGGVLHAQGSAHGSFSQPHVDVTWKGEKIAWPDLWQLAETQGKAAIIIDRTMPLFLKAFTLDGSANGLASIDRKLTALTAHVQFSPSASAPMIVNIQGDAALMKQVQPQHFSLVTQGTTAQHVIDVSITQPEQKWVIKADGGLKDLGNALRWQGTISRVDGDGLVAGHLAAPAPFSLSKQRVQLDQFLFEGNDAHFVIEQFIREKNSISTHGNFDRLKLASLLQFTTQQPVLSTDLQLTGDWSLAVADTVNGSVKLRRQSGDIVMKGSNSVPLGLRNLDANVQASNGHLMLRFNADGQQVGHIDVNAAASMTNGPNGLSIASNAPLSGSAKLDVPSLAWTAALMSPSLRTEGHLQSTISVSGTYADPRMAGNVAISGLRLFLMDQGIDFQHGTLDAQFQNDGLNVKQLRFQSPDGDVNVTGPINWTEGKTAAHLVLNAERYILFNRVDRRLVISGQSQIDWNDNTMQSGIAPDNSKNRIKVAGAFNVDSGYFDLGKEGTPGLSDDVVIVGRTQKQANRTLTDLDIKVSLGSGVALKGRGLDATLAGQIRVLSDAKQGLRAQGALNIPTGTYTAYGHKLAIEKGELLFNGPIGNPALDILAMQRGQEVEVGVLVGGTVLSPRITLVSEPSVPDTEKLSWLVLGHGLDMAGSSDLSALQAAASALLAGPGSGGGQSQIASAFGLDEINVKSDQSNAQQRVVTLGKRVSSRLEVGYEQGIESVSSVLHLRYTISKRLSLDAEAGTRSALSLFYNILFD